MKESFNISGENLLRKVREVIEDGNATSITIQDKAGKDLMHFPLAFGLVGTLFAPVLAAVGALAAIVGECTIVVERKPKEGEQRKPDDVFKNEG